MTKLEQLEQTAKELLAEIEKMKGIDLNNTWCEATEENYKALPNIEGIAFRKETKYFIIDANGMMHNVLILPNPNPYKQIHLVNGKFEFVKSELEKYITVAKGINPPHKWFIIDDEIDVKDCPFQTKKINAKHADILDAYLKNNSVEIEIVGQCTNKGTPTRFIEDYQEHRNYRLKEKPKQWYEIESNFPCIATDGKDFAVLDSKFCETWMINRFANLRPATKEEVLSLLVEP